MIIIDSEIYEELAENIAPMMANNRIETRFELSRYNKTYTFILQAIVYEKRDIIPIWWEMSTTLDKNEVDNDFSFDRLKKYIEDMTTLLTCDGSYFRCKINGDECEGIIVVAPNKEGKINAYLCQDVAIGDRPSDCRGYKYGWNVLSGSKKDLMQTDVESFKIISRPKIQKQPSKDCQYGDILSDGKVRLEVIFRSGELVVCKRSDGTATKNYTLDELYNLGFRKKKTIVITRAEAQRELAKARGVSVDSINIE